MNIVNIGFRGHVQICGGVITSPRGITTRRLRLCPPLELYNYRISPKKSGIVAHVDNCISVGDKQLHRSIRSGSDNSCLYQIGF